MGKVKKTFRIEDETYLELVKLSEEWGVSQGAAIERAIQNARQNERSCHTSGAAPDGTSAAIGALAAQLSVKDEQIAALNRALDAAHETAKAAQVLHAQERKALESTEQKARWRWPWGK